MVIPDIRLNAKREAAVLTAGFMFIITLGIFTAIGLVIAALWLLVQIATLALQSAIEALASVGQTYQAADSLIRFLILVALGYIIYRVVQRVLRR